MKNYSPPRRFTAKRGFSLIELLIAVLLLALLAGGAMYYVNGGGATQTTANGTRKVTPKTRAHDVECQSNLRQIRMAVGMAHDGDTDAKFPASLDELHDISAIRKCPDGGEPYTYNPQTGEVHCPHIGHEKL